MTTFVLVHGAWLGGWCYKRVAQQLQRAGHEAYRPTLTGLGERAHLMSPSINLDTHIADILGVIQWEELSDFVLCGHSYGGMVISGVADKIPEKIRSLVYLDAFLPENGQSIMDITNQGAAEMRADAVQNGDGYKLSPIPAKVFQVNKHDAGWVDAVCVKHPLACMEQKIVLTGGCDRVKKRTYILATGWTPTPFPPFAAAVKSDPNWRYITIDCGHDVMLDRPRELADLLLTAV